MPKIGLHWVKVEKIGTRSGKVRVKDISISLATLLLDHTSKNIRILFNYKNISSSYCISSYRYEMHFNFRTVRVSF